METDKVIVIEKTGYRSEDIISCNGVARCIRNHGYRGGLWIDTYNQCVNDIAGTIKARVNANCMYFVSEDSSNEEDGQSDDRGERSTSGI